MVLTNSLFITRAKMETITAELKTLQRILYIFYLVQSSQKLEVWVFINSDSKINTMTSVYKKDLGF